MLCHTDSINNFKKHFHWERERERERWRTAHIQNLSLFYWLACCNIWMAQYWQVIQLTLAVTLKSWYRGKNLESLDRDPERGTEMWHSKHRNILVIIHSTSRVNKLVMLITELYNFHHSNDTCMHTNFHGQPTSNNFTDTYMYKVNCKLGFQSLSPFKEYKY